MYIGRSDIDGGAVSELIDLTNVTITSVTDDEVLAYDSGSGEWINQTPAEAGLSVVGHTHNTSDITSGTFADARIAQSNVTQHQAALSITSSQVTEISNLTATEGAQLENIDSVTITNTQWGYVGSLDQSLATTDVVTFASIDTGNGPQELDAAAGKGVTGLDANAVTGTAGTSGNYPEWDSNGDIVDSGSSEESILQEATALAVALG